MTAEEKDARIEELQEQYEQVKIEFGRASGAVRYHMNLARSAYIAMIATVIVISPAYLFFAHTWLQLGLCLALLGASIWNMWSRNQIVGFQIARQGESIQKMESIARKIAEFKGQTDILEFLYLSMGIPFQPDPGE